MSGFGNLLRHDVRCMRANVISLVVLFGIVVVPSFYAWFNIAGSWDPYGNTKNLAVAVASSDKGYASDLLPVRLNLGERVAADLCTSESIGYVSVSENKAREGVRSGAYYAALIIPEDFSERLLTGAVDGEPAEVVFLQNEKLNAIAEIVTNKAASAVKRDINASFARAVADVGTGALDELGNVLGDDELERFASNLNRALETSADALDRASADMRGADELLASTQGLLGSSSTGYQNLAAPANDAAEALVSTADGIRDAQDALGSAETSAGNAFSASAQAIGSVNDAIDQAFATAEGQASSIGDGLAKAQAACDEQIAALQDLADRLNGQDALTKRFEKHYEVGSIEYDRVHEVTLTIEGLADRVQQAIDELTELSGALQKTKGDLEQGTADAKDAQAELKQLADNAGKDLAELKDSFDGSVAPALEDLASMVEQASAQTRTIAGNLAGTLESADAAAADARDDLGAARTALADTADALDQKATDLRDLHDRLGSALEGHDIDQIRSILTAEPAEIGAFIAEPVKIDRTPIFPVENNGSAMAPFYSTLAIWIGGVVMAALLKAVPGADLRERLGTGETAAYLARLGLFAGIGLLQATLIWAGNVLFLGVQCAHPILAFLAGWVASFVFVNIIFSLTASFGDVGKAAAVVLMVVQVAGAGGTFPRQMLPSVFQAIYSWLPFVHAENAFRAAQFGIWNNDFWLELARLGAYVVPALVLGLVLRRPLIGLNEKVEEKLAATKVM